MLNTCGQTMLARRLIDVPWATVSAIRFDIPVECDTLSGAVLLLKLELYPSVFALGPLLSRIEVSTSTSPTTWMLATRPRPRVRLRTRWKSPPASSILKTVDARIIHLGTKC